MEVKTAFQVKFENKVEAFAVRATGQEAVAIVKKDLTRKHRVILKGFFINEEFKPVDLSSNWSRQLNKKF